MDYQKFQQRSLGKQSTFKGALTKLRKRPNSEIDHIFHDLHEEVFSEIDCMQCAACCKFVGPRWTRQDIKRVSKVLKMKEGDFEDTYLKIDEDSDHVLKDLPCAFLNQDQSCMIYSDRPKACREYPHTNRRKMKQIFNLTLKNSAHCPAVEKIMDGIVKKQKL